MIKGMIKANTPCPKCGKLSCYCKLVGTRKQRGYDEPWYKLRNQFIKDNPLCADCLANNITTPAQHVHHLIKIKDAPQLRLDYDNLLSLWR